MNKNFGIITTQSPNKGNFAKLKTRIRIMSSFKISNINFPIFIKDELIEIAKGLKKHNNYEEKDGILVNLLILYGLIGKKNSVDDVQCFTIREIEDVMSAFTQKNIYDTIM